MLEEKNRFQVFMALENPGLLLTTSKKHVAWRFEMRMRGGRALFTGTCSS